MRLTLVAAAFLIVGLPLTAVADPPFLRGDCNSDSRVDVADGVWLLNYYFKGGPTPLCMEACDADGSATLDWLDAIYIIHFTWLNGPSLPPPFPNCGTVPEPIDCVESPCP